jgi:hypothetical protein
VLDVEEVETVASIINKTVFRQCDVYAGVCLTLNVRRFIEILKYLKSERFVFSF